MLLGEWGCWASTASLGNLFQCLTTLTIRNLFLISSLNLPSSSLKTFPLIPLLCALIKYIPLSTLKNDKNSRNFGCSVYLVSLLGSCSHPHTSTGLLWTKHRVVHSFHFAEDWTENYSTVCWVWGQLPCSAIAFCLFLTTTHSSSSTQPQSMGWILKCTLTVHCCFQQHSSCCFNVWISHDRDRTYSPLHRGFVCLFVWLVGCFFFHKELSDCFVEMYVPLTSLSITQTDGICLKSLPKSAEKLGWNLCLFAPGKITLESAFILKLLLMKTNGSLKLF